MPRCIMLRGLMDLSQLQSRIAYQFKDEALLREALTHKSYTHEHKFSGNHNERLEFLGDSVLSLTVSEILMKQLPTRDEGQLSKIRSQIVSESALAKYAREISLGDNIRLGKGEELSGGRSREALLADVFEALLAAIFLDGGIEAARKSIRVLIPVLELDAEHWSKESSYLLTLDHKSRLQELCQSWNLGVPRYECMNASSSGSEGPFIMAVFIGGRELARIEGPSKKEATQKLAQDLLMLGEKQLRSRLANLETQMNIGMNL